MYNKEELKEKAIQLYLSGMTFTKVGEELGYSRKYITDLIQDDKRIINKRNRTILKVNKRKNTNDMRLHISNDFLLKIGIDKNPEIIDFVDVTIDEGKKEIIIKKHNM